MSLNRKSRYVAALAIAGTAMATTPHIATATPTANSAHVMNSSRTQLATTLAADPAGKDDAAIPANVVGTPGAATVSEDQPKASFFGGFMDILKGIWAWIAKLLGLGGGVKDPIPDPGGGTKPQPVRPTATVTPTLQPTTRPTSTPTTKPTSKPTPTITHTNGPIGNPGLKPKPQPTTTPTSTPTTKPNPGGSAWLAELNRIRAEKGLNPVVEDPSLSSECVKHVNYMKKWGMGGHFEVEGRPEYTPQGHKCAKESNLVSGARNELDSFRIWVGSPAHYRGMVRPNLKRVGFAYGNGYGALNVIAGLGR